MILPSVALGETWMRCSLRSYLRCMYLSTSPLRLSDGSYCYSVLDPILYDLLDPAVKRTPSLTKITENSCRVSLTSVHSTRHMLITS